MYKFGFLLARGRISLASTSTPGSFSFGLQSWAVVGKATFIQKEATCLHSTYNHPKTYTQHFT
jgi:hypothetical protein